MEGFNPEQARAIKAIVIEALNEYNANEIFSQRSAARLLGVTPWKVRQLIKLGILQKTPEGNISRAELIKYTRNHARHTL